MKAHELRISLRIDPRKDRQRFRSHKLGVDRLDLDSPAPNFEMTPATLDLLQSRGIVVFGADLWASDWNPMTPEQELKLITDRPKIARKGIILFHDPKAQTAAMLPAFLRYLRDNDYRVVHVVPASPGPQSRNQLEKSYNSDN